MNKKRTFDSSYIIGIALLVGILILINLISINWFTRFDFTQGNIYTLSEASKKAVAELEDPLTVKCYFTKDLPPPYSSNARYLRDQLEEYRAHSNGNFRFKFVDPSADSEYEVEAQGYQVAPGQVQVVEADKIEVKKIYMGMVFLYKDKRETIPLVQTTSALEYDITSTIKKITAQRIPKVGFLQGHGEPNPFEEMTTVMSQVQKNYEIQLVDVSKGEMVPDDLDGLLIIRPTENIPQWDLFAIDQYIMKGGKVGFLINQVDAKLQEGRAIRRTLGIDDFTTNYGFRINGDLIYDRNCGRVNMQTQQGWITFTTAIDYPFFPVLTNFNPDINIVRDLEELYLIYPSSIDTSLVSPEDSTLTYELEIITWTSEQSNKQVGRFEINPNKPTFRQLNYPLSGIPMAATIIGSFPSYFAGKDIPQPEEGEPFQGEVIPVSPETRLVVVGDGNFITDSWLSSLSSANFFLNTVDWLAQDESLIHIRNREITTRPLTDTSKSLKAVTKYGNIFIPALLVILLGVILWQIRSKHKPEL